MGRISGTTRAIALLGRPVAHSRSPAMQNAAFAAAGLDFVYVPFDVGADSVAAAAEALRTLGFRGANVTTPLKRTICAHLDALGRTAEMAGAVNVIVNEGGRLTGHMTDGEGFMLALADAGVDWRGRHMTLLGAGGAATAVAIQAARDGIGGLTLCNRRDGFFDEGQRTVAGLRDRFGIAAEMLDLADRDGLARAIASTDILVNGTPLGMKETSDAAVIDDPALFHPGLIVCDLIYAPPETRFLRIAAGAGCRTISGLGMQLFQAVSAFRLWTGQDMPMDVARKEIFG